MALTPKQERFVQEYLVDLNATAAARRAGYSAKTADRTGPALLGKTCVSQAVQAAMQARRQRTEVTQDYVIDRLREITDMAASDAPDSALKYANKLKALELLGRHLGAWEPKDSAPADSGHAAFELPARLIAPAFAADHLDILAGRHTEYVEKGGRGSAKSSFVSLEVVSLLRTHPEMHALCCRKVSNTLRDSVFTQVRWAIEALGLGGDFSHTKSPLEITCRSTGQKIYFRGADDPLKLKSIKPPFGYIGILWFEELDQFAGDEECRSIQQSAVRGGDAAYIFKSFNPPKTKSNWANRACALPRESRRVTHSDYRSVPPEWLGRAFLDEAEDLRQRNPAAYEHEYLGIPNGSGGMVFENLAPEPIPAERIAAFDRVLCGVDWGFYPDPWAFNRVHYDAARRTLYIFDELTALKTGNRETAELLRKRGLTGEDLITADSAEPKSIADYRTFGLRCLGAEKGPGSVDYSMKWLQSLVKIVIDPERCPDTYREFAEYEYERTRDGAVLSGYPDRNNHHIDAVRYATETIWKRRGQ